MADLGGAWGMHAPPWASKFFRFHAVFGKIWRVHAPPWRVHAPPSGKSWIRHCRMLPISTLSYEQTERQRQNCNASLWIHCDSPHDAWKWVWDRFWSVTMHSYGSLPLDVPLDARCGYALNNLCQRHQGNSGYKQRDMPVIFTKSTATNCSITSFSQCRVSTAVTTLMRVTLCLKVARCM